MTSERELPGYASERFDRWFAKRRNGNGGSRGKVILWDDTFVRYHEPHIGHAAVRVLEAAGFSVVRDLVGHGIGRKLHEEPAVPNFGIPGTGMILREGMTLAIEPMVNAGMSQVRVSDDGWTVRTADGKPSAHFEHTIVVRENEAEILTQDVQ